MKAANPLRWIGSILQAFIFLILSIASLFLLFNIFLDFNINHGFSSIVFFVLSLFLLTFAHFFHTATYGTSMVYKSIIGLNLVVVFFLYRLCGNLPFSLVLLSGIIVIQFIANLIIRVVLNYPPKTGSWKKRYFWVLAFIYFFPFLNIAVDGTFWGQFDFLDIPKGDRFQLVPSRKYEINSQRYRGPAVKNIDRSSPRILCIGDSATYGLYYPYADSYPAQLQNLLRNKGFDQATVINGGVPAANLIEIGHQYHRFKWWKPQVVALMCGFHIREFKAKSSNVQSILPKTLARQMRGLLALPLFFACQQDAATYKENFHDWQVELVRLVQTVKDNGSVPILMSYPYSGLPNEVVRTMENIAQENSVAFVNMQKIFTGSGNLSIALDQNHPTPEGYKKIAENLLPIVTSQFSSPSDAQLQQHPDDPLVSFLKP